MAEQTIEVRHAPDRARYEIRVDGELAGYADYIDEGNDVLAFPHTEVFPQYGGRGVGTELVAAVLKDLADKGQQVRPHCWFLRGYLQRHAELVGLVPEGERSRFGL